MKDLKLFPGNIKTFKMMKCTPGLMKECCRKRPVYELTGKEKLCKAHFLAYFEKKVRKTIRIYRLVGKKERILVAVSGGKDSTAALFLLKRIIKNKNVSIEALHIDQSIGNYSKRNKENIIKFCERYRIKLHHASFKEEFGYSLCYIQSMLKSKGFKLKSCNICGILKRYILNKKAKGLGATKVATGHNLDDEAQSVIMNIFKNQTEILPRLGPASGDCAGVAFIPRIKPLYFCTEEEVKLYSRLIGFEVVYESCPCSEEAYRKSVEKMLNSFERTNPGTKHGIINSLLGIKPLLTAKCRGKANVCEICSEPSARNICNACKIVEMLKN